MTGLASFYLPSCIDGPTYQESSVFGNRCWNRISMLRLRPWLLVGMMRSQWRSEYEASIILEKCPRLLEISRMELIFLLKLPAGFNQDFAFLRFAREKRLLIPGAAFGQYGEGYVRLSYSMRLSRKLFMKAWRSMKNMLESIETRGNGPV